MHCACQNSPARHTLDMARKSTALATQVGRAVAPRKQLSAATGELVGRLVHFDAANPGETKLAPLPGALANGQRRVGTHVTNGMPGTFFVIAVPRKDGRGRPTKPIPDGIAVNAEKPMMAYRNGQVIPHALCIEAGQSIAFKNETVRGILVRLDHRQTVEVPALVGTELSDLPEKLIPYEVRVVSEPNGPRGLILALGYPYRMTIADEDGFFRLGGLAVGDWDLEIWHDTDGGGAATVRQFSQVSSSVKAIRAGVRVRIGAGQNDIGQIGLSDSDLKKWTLSFPLPWPF